MVMWQHCHECGQPVDEFEPGYQFGLCCTCWGRRVTPPAIEEDYRVLGGGTGTWIAILTIFLLALSVLFGYELVRITLK